jgi:hypothetical protein
MFLEKRKRPPSRDGGSKFDNLTQSVTLISQILYLIRMYLPQQVAGLVICDGEQKWLASRPRDLWCKLA